MVDQLPITADLNEDDARYWKQNHAGSGETAWLEEQRNQGEDVFLPENSEINPELRSRMNELSVVKLAEQFKGMPPEQLKSM